MANGLVSKQPSSEIQIVREVKRIYQVVMITRNLLKSPQWIIPFTKYKLIKLNIEICIQYQIQNILGRDMKEQTFQVQINRIADYVHELNEFIWDMRNKMKYREL